VEQLLAQLDELVVPEVTVLSLVVLVELVELAEVGMQAVLLLAQLQDLLVEMELRNLVFLQTAVTVMPEEMAELHF
jgi:hypothetical protein